LVWLERVLFFYAPELFPVVILLSVRQLPDHLINAISGKRKRGGSVQSNATLAGFTRSRLGLRTVYHNTLP
jgi:hypothetical protein